MTAARKKKVEAEAPKVGHRKWETTHKLLDDYIDVADQPFKRRTVLKELYDEVAKYPNQRSRQETALAATVGHAIHKRLDGPPSVTLDERIGAAGALQDLIAREARVRVVAAVRRRSKLKRFGMHKTLELIADELASAISRGLR